MTHVPTWVPQDLGSTPVVPQWGDLFDRIDQLVGKSCGDRERVVWCRRLELQRRDDMGLNITVISYCDAIDFGVMSCPQLLPEPADLAGRIPGALRELEHAIGKSSN